MNKSINRRNYFSVVKIMIWSFFLGFSMNGMAQNLQVHYGLTTDVTGDTQVIDETGNGYNGTLLNGASISSFDGIPVIELSTSNGYVDLGAGFGSVISSLSDFTIAVKVYVPSTSNISDNGNFVWSFANSNTILNDAKGCMFFSAKNSKYVISPTNYVNNSSVGGASELTKGSWQTIVYVQRNSFGKLFINGLLNASGNISMSPSELGATPYNYLGRSCYSADDYLRGAKIADFRLYDGALSTDQVKELSGIATNYYEVTKLVDFNFSSVQDLAGNYTGILNYGAEIVSYGEGSVLKLGENDGYFDFSAGFGEIIAQLDSFSFSTNLFIPNTSNPGGSGNFVWTFANSSDMAATANGNMFFGAGSGRYVISKTNWQAESSIKVNDALPKGRWINLTYTERYGIGNIYIDGNLTAQGNIAVKPKDLGATTSNFLGRSCYVGDSYLKSAMYDNFVVYQGVLKESDIWTLCEDLVVLNDVNDSIALTQAMDELEIVNADAVHSNIILPSVIGDNVLISWTSGNTNVITDEGLISRPAVGSDPVVVTLTAHLVYNNVSSTKDIEVTVIPQYTDAESVAMDLENLDIDGNIYNIKSSVGLPISTGEGSKVVWSSDSPEFLNHVGQVVQLSPYGDGKKSVILTATVSKGNESASKTFEVWVAEAENREAYLLAYFTGNDTNGEQIRFALSNNGINYTPLNNGNRIISSDTISIKGGVRDPHILRGEDGETFYMVVTDMKSAEGWSSNRGMVLLKSNDLVNWSHSTVHFPTKWSSTWSNVKRVWAPQTIYDPVAKKYLVYFSLYTGDATCPYDRIYYCYANEDFTDLEGEPQILYDRGTATIDGDIVFNQVDSLYYMFFKNESLGGISQVTSSTLTNVVGSELGSQWSEASKPLQQTTEAVEGAGVFQLINSDDWILMYDCYANGHYQFCTTPDLKNFTFAQNNYDMNARHGTTISISNEEIDRLVAKWPSSALTNVPEGARNINIKENGIDINTDSKTIDIEVAYGTDISSFDPELYASPGTSIIPAGPQDFSSGAVNYTFTQNGASVTYAVNVMVAANTVIPGFHADPDILYSEKTGRFYLYSTTDGFPGWGGYSFDVFSSPDMVHWTNEGTMLDLSTNQVSWATGNAWAPCIEEKKMDDGSYKYYFYFSGNAGIKKIGVAIANDPVGPYIDSGAPMISELPSGVGGQLIDGDVFTDPVSGKSYFYYGNGFMAVAELNDDMISIDESTVKVLTPSGGSLSDYAYREAPYVFYRDGLYYFMWSVDDTGSPNYHVAYGTSTSPTGPVTVASSPIVIIQDAANELYGTAHNSVIQIPGKDEWYIVYHRINKDYINNEPGIHREVCIDRMEFNENGTIIQVKPTRKGIEPVVLDGASTAIKKKRKKR